jgi:hypothetical protein
VKGVVKILTSVPRIVTFIIIIAINSKGKDKGKSKAIPVQAWTDPEVSRSLRLPDFMIVGT